MSVAPPFQGLGSNYNYFLADGGNAITGLNVEITFAEPLISTSNGFGFQLNCYAQELPNAPSTTPTWQQYVVYAEPGDNGLYGIIDNWEGTVPDNTDQQIINDETNSIHTLKTATHIPAGATINIAPVFSSSNVITGVQYTYTPPNGSPSSQSVTLTNLDVYDTDNRVNSQYESPISAFTLNIVGDYNGNNGVFTSGSGTIVYHANQPLTVLTNEPSYTSFQDGTGETSNSIYGELPASHSTSITQSWGVTQDGEPSVFPSGNGKKLPIPARSRNKKRGTSLPMSRHFVRMKKELSE